MNALLNGNRQVALTGIFLLGMHDDLYESGGTPCNDLPGSSSLSNANQKVQIGLQVLILQL